MPVDHSDSSSPRGSEGANEPGWHACAQAGESGPRSKHLSTQMSREWQPPQRTSVNSGTLTTCLRLPPTQALLK